MGKDLDVFEFRIASEAKRAPPEVMRGDAEMSRAEMSRLGEPLDLDESSAGAGAVEVAEWRRLIRRAEDFLSVLKSEALLPIAAIKDSPNDSVVVVDNDNQLLSNPRSRDANGDQKLAPSRGTTRKTAAACDGAKSSTKASPTTASGKARVSGATKKTPACRRTAAEKKPIAASVGLAEKRKKATPFQWLGRWRAEALLMKWLEVRARDDGCATEKDAEGWAGILNHDAIDVFDHEADGLYKTAVV